MPIVPYIRLIVYAYPEKVFNILDLFLLVLGLDDRNVPKAVRATENTTSTPITATSQSQNGLSVTGDARISPAKVSAYRYIPLHFFNNR